MVQTLTTTGLDGIGIRATDRGSGPAVLVVHGGLDDGASWQQVAEALTPSPATRRRVITLHRRQYRLDLPGSGWSITEEAADVVALAAVAAAPVLLVGHSSGAVVALEALVAAPDAFAGAVLYEPPLHTRHAEWAAQIARARRARTTAGAMTIFLRDIVRLPAWQAVPAAAAIAAVPRMRELAPRQIDDADAINRLGVRLDAYSRITAPVLLLGGERSPRHLLDRMSELAEHLPASATVVLDGQGHGAHVGAPQRVAAVIESHASVVL
ncbi:alpha/beta fold hydrolase [Pseudonocardia sp. TRM90224]|uniref:alpha/beta fold hydrolase n=1 Tax=Pseudonocardia sp. TRM90224 TaxID=2812678 RepID=UPI001E57C9AD|nr:alpha/beta hydrolase [Pseudonocardia sp. TRM90224]